MSWFSAEPDKAHCVCPTCGFEWWMTVSRSNELIISETDVWCPLGHNIGTIRRIKPEL